jgi:hypothetical protein
MLMLNLSLSAHILSRRVHPVSSCHRQRASSCSQGSAPSAACLAGLLAPLGRYHASNPAGANGFSCATPALFSPLGFALARRPCMLSAATASAPPPILKALLRLPPALPGCMPYSGNIMLRTLPVLMVLAAPPRPLAPALFSPLGSAPARRPRMLMFNLISLSAHISSCRVHPVSSCHRQRASSCSPGSAPSAACLAGLLAPLERYDASNPAGANGFSCATPPFFPLPSSPH